MKGGPEDKGEICKVSLDIVMIDGRQSISTSEDTLKILVIVYGESDRFAIPLT